MEQGMRFDKVGGGTFGVRLQAAFEQAQKICFERNTKTEVEAKIVLYPSESRDHPEFGQISYQVGVKQPPVVSPKFSTVVQGGKIISDGVGIGSAMTVEMDLPTSEQKGPEHAGSEAETAGAEAQSGREDE